MLLIWLVLAACAIAVVTDIRTRRIPNILTGGLALTALVAHIPQGWRSFSISLLMLVIVLFLGTAVFSMGWLGGGDVKLAAAGAAAFGFPDAVAFLLYTSIGGGILALMYALANGRLEASVRSVGALLRPFVYQGMTAVAPAAPLAFPYATAIAVGASAVALSHTVAPFLRLPL